VDGKSNAKLSTKEVPDPVEPGARDRTWTVRLSAPRPPGGPHHGPGYKSRAIPPVRAAWRRCGSCATIASDSGVIGATVGIGRGAPFQTGHDPAGGDPGSTPDAQLFSGRHVPGHSRTHV